MFCAILTGIWLLCSALMFVFSAVNIDTCNNFYLPIAPVFRPSDVGLMAVLSNNVVAINKVSF